MSSDSLSNLGPGWQLAFAEAWASFQAGSFGIGAVIVDPDDSSIVAAGRNRVAQRDEEARTLTGNMMAHAEMNAFAGLDRLNADGLDLYTTLEPCLMCAATAMLLKVRQVHFAANDEFFEGLDDLWSKHPLTATRRPTTLGPLPDDLARFARLLPMAYTLRQFPGRAGEQLARRSYPDLSAVADGLSGDSTFMRIVDSGTVGDAIDHLDL